MTTLSTIKDEARERFKSRVADILENIDPSQVHISEDSRIYFKDETCGAMFSEIDRAVEVVTEEQNRVVNSGRKLFQEGMKVGVRAVVEELQLQIRLQVLEVKVMEVAQKVKKLLAVKIKKESVI